MWLCPASRLQGSVFRKTSTWQFLPIFKCWACKQEHLPYDFRPSLIPLRKYLRNLSITRDSCLLFNPNKLPLTPQVRHASVVGLLAPPACVRSRVWLSATPWTGARQAPLSMGLSRQEDWSGLPRPPPDLPDPGMEPVSFVSCIGRGVPYH